MHGSIDKSPQADQSIYRSWNIKLIALPVLLVIALIGYAVSHPDVSRWISEAVQAEFVVVEIVQPPPAGVEMAALGQAFGLRGRPGALTCVGIIFAALNALLRKRRRTDAHPMLQEAARRVAQIFDVKYIVMGHSHRAMAEPVGNGTLYFNLGSWTPGRSSDGFPHVAVTSGSGYGVRSPFS